MFYGILYSVCLGAVTMALGGARSGEGLITSLQGMFAGASIAVAAVVWIAGSAWSVWSFTTMRERSAIPLPRN